MTDFNPTWQTFEGVEVLRVGQSNFIAVPATGKKNAARFVVITINPREEYCQVTKKEVHSWLFKAAKSEAQNIEFEAHSRKLRLDRVQAYLEVRATRAAAPVQTSFAF